MERDEKAALAFAGIGGVVGILFVAALIWSAWATSREEKGPRKEQLQQKSTIYGVPAEPVPVSVGDGLSQFGDISEFEQPPPKPWVYRVPAGGVVVAPQQHTVHANW